MDVKRYLTGSVICIALAAIVGSLLPVPAPVNMGGLVVWAIVCLVVSSAMSRSSDLRTVKALVAQLVVFVPVFLLFARWG